jgi:hypothetical protein
VCANSLESPSLLKVHLSFSKCEQVEEGVNVFLGAHFVQCKQLLVIRGGVVLCLVCISILLMGTHLSRLLLLRQIVGAWLRSVWTSLLVTAFGLEPPLQRPPWGWKTRALGRWNSVAFLVYVQTPRAQLAGFSRSLAAGTS